MPRYLTRVNLPSKRQPGDLNAFLYNTWRFFRSIGEAISNQFECLFRPLFGGRAGRQRSRKSRRPIGGR